jgi:tRNA pseudouridine55 synthase
MTQIKKTNTRVPIDGVLLLDKPEGFSSTQALGKAKWLLNAEKAGHTGTLDPFATGLLPLCFGEATKFSRFLLDAKKSYRATLCLGQTSSTGDTEGVLSTPLAVDVDADKLNRTLPQFIGAQTQIPPMTSALKRDGVPLYKLARQGLEVEREARAITIYDIAVASLDAQVLVLDVTVSKGTYVRVLAEDIGRALGCGAYLTGLRRTGTGGMTITGACSLVQMEELPANKRVALLLPAQSLVADLTRLNISNDAARSLKQGQMPHIDWPLLTPAAINTEYAIFNTDAIFMGVAIVAAIDGNNAILQSVRMMAGD